MRLSFDLTRPGPAAVVCEEHGSVFFCQYSTNQTIFCEKVQGLDKKLQALMNTEGIG